jgi:hypothetical protein
MRLARKFVGFGCMAMAACIFAVGVRVEAQSGPPGPPLGPGPNVFFRQMGPGPLSPDDAIGFVGIEGRLGRDTVTGTPFTANYSQENTQLFADGNRIARTVTGALSRDSNGRTRRDFTLPALGEWASSGRTPPHVILINDPVSGVDYVLEPDRKIARKMMVPSAKFEKGAGDRQRFERELPKDTTTTSLGTQMVNGLSAQGTRTTRTIPAGAIGNEKPIVITVERWYSPELQMNVMIKRSDPRTGDNVFQLTNVVRTEPDASLFQVPAGYTMKEGGKMILRQKGPGPPQN